MKKVLLGLGVAILVVAALFWVLGRPRGSVAQGKATPEPKMPAVKAPDVVVAEGSVMPAQSAVLSFSIGGLVTQVGVAEGQTVAAAQVLATLGVTQMRNAVAEAEANLRTAQAQLARAQAGPAQEDIAAAEAAVDVARAGVKAAAKVARNGVKDAEAGVVTARANLARVQAGLSAESVAIAARRVEAAKNALWTSQAQRDSACAYDDKAICDGAKGAVAQAEEGLRIAELQYQQAKAGATSQDIAVGQAQLAQSQGQVPAAQGRVAQAQEQVASAQAQVKQAEANLARAKRGPSAEDVAVVSSQLQQARVAVERARSVLADAELRAPFAGSIVAMHAKVGEFIVAGQAAAQLADLSQWQIETTDFTELSVIKVQVGAPVVIAVDALPGVQVPGKVTHIKALGESRRGDITYKVVITPDAQDARLRWNMTAKVTIKPL